MIMVGNPWPAVRFSEVCRGPKAWPIRPVMSETLILTRIVPLLHQSAQAADAVTARVRQAVEALVAPGGRVDRHRLDAERRYADVKHHLHAHRYRQTPTNRLGAAVQIVRTSGH